MIRYLVHLIHAYLILTILAPFPVWAAVGTSAAETWYVVAGCANNGDGLAQSCAASAGATGAFNDPASVIWTATTGVDNDDTLYICGTHIQKFLTVGSSVSAPVGSEIKIRWDCPGNPGLMRNVYTLTTATTPGNWTEESTNIWYIDLSSLTWDDPQRVWMNGTELLVSDTKVNLGTQINGGTPVSKWFHDGALGRLYLHSVGNPATGLTTLEGLWGVGANDYAPVRINGSSIAGIDIVNPNIEGGSLASIYTLGPQRIRVYGTNPDRSTCNVGKHSARAILLQGSSTTGTGTNGVDNQVYDCTIDLVFPDHLADYRFELNTLGNVIEVTGNTRPVVKRNTIRDGSHSNIYAYAIGGTDTVVDGDFSFNDITFRDSVMYARPINVDEDTLGRVTNNKFNSNTITRQTVRMQFNADGNYFVGNIVRDVRASVVLKSGTTQHNQSMSFEKYAGPSQDNIIANNEFENAYAPCIEYRNSGTSSTGHQFKNNIFYNCGSPSYTGLANGESVAFYIPSGFTGTFTASNNLFFPTGPNPVSYKGTKYATVSSWQSACSGGDSCTGNLAVDPQFINFPTNLRPAIGSAARGAGVTYTGCTDLLGRICTTPLPDIGAYQITSPDGASLRFK